MVEELKLKKFKKILKKKLVKPEKKNISNKKKEIQINWN